MIRHLRVLWHLHCCLTWTRPRDVAVGVCCHRYGRLYQVECLLATGTFHKSVAIPSDFTYAKSHIHAILDLAGATLWREICEREPGELAHPLVAGVRGQG